MRHIQWRLRGPDAGDLARRVDVLLEPLTLLGVRVSARKTEDGAEIDVAGMAAFVDEAERMVDLVLAAAGRGKAARALPAVEEA